MLEVQEAMAPLSYARGLWGDGGVDREGVGDGGGGALAGAGRGEGDGEGAGGDGNEVVGIAGGGRGGEDCEQGEGQDCAKGCAALSCEAYQ